MFELLACSCHGKRSKTSVPTRTPLEVLCTSDTTKLCHWLCMFVKEARHHNRQLYTSHSLTQLLSGIQRFISSRMYTTPETSYILPEVVYMLFFYVMTSSSGVCIFNVVFSMLMCYAQLKFILLMLIKYVIQFSIRNSILRNYRWI